MKIKEESFEDGVKVNKHIVLPTWLQNCKEERVQTMENQKNAKQCDKECEGNLIMFIPQNKQDLFSNPNSSPNSASSSDEVDGFKSTQMFNELNDENMKILCDAMDKKVPNQNEITKEIASTVLLCRSGMRKGGEKDNFLVKKDGKQETWMLFVGVDSQAKELISKELAKVVFGSYKNFVNIAPSYDENIGKEKVDNLEEKKPCLSLDLNMAIEVDAQNARITEDFRILELVDKQIKFETQEL
ncbi:hypothetical protein TSUD_19760 [Trifolium subterraneum]|uniref:Uncharacterized protein n=1 Tax=Trifolium subterraneum TaxID=3900 RepID=A0A2Z6MYA2_TRISU|nr:hypothetical protein TSUD_19760 [Trifolium subterraneum]